jgi:ATPase subunit of ABC transporter with duplicated ATPase domains
MSTEIQERCNTIEECYEFTLSYAAQGLPSDEGSESGKQVRQQLAHAVEALSGLEESCAAAIKQEQLAPAEKYQAFFAVLARDAQSSIAAIELVLAQPAISSQLIDNLNASMHLRALLADLFLVTEILELQQSRAKAMVSN